jgi:nicotinamide-nucleotide amidase
MSLKAKILEFNARGGAPIELDKVLDGLLDQLIHKKVYDENLMALRDQTCDKLNIYRKQSGRNNAIVGMSGGIDSALTATMFRDAGYTVFGVTLPIEQHHDETMRGVEACEHLGINHLQVDLTEQFKIMCRALSHLDANLPAFERDETKDTRVRRGNIKARLRMLTLYNLASLHKGLVASTDNFSEMAAGFWTLHGDVGDVAPIQSFTKSWEVPAVAEYQGIPESIILANPTDGLGIGDGDERQLGCSYLEFDIALLSELFDMRKHIEDSQRAEEVFNIVDSRVGSTTYKRNNPSNLNHPTQPNRYDLLGKLDNKLLRR